MRLPRCRFRFIKYKGSTEYWICDKSVWHRGRHEGHLAGARRSP